MRNSSLVQIGCTENVRRLSSEPKLRIVKLVAVVGERSVLVRSRIVSSGGRIRSANAGISSVKRCENHFGRKTKVSRASVILPG